MGLVPTILGTLVSCSTNGASWAIATKGSGGRENLFLNICVVFQQTSLGGLINRIVGQLVTGHVSSHTLLQKIFSVAV